LAAYQDAVTAPLSREDDDDACFDEDDEQDEEYDSEVRNGQGIQKLRSVEKVGSLMHCCLPFTDFQLLQLRKIIRSIRASPQRRQEWIREVQVSPDFIAGKLGQQPLMPILDVKTRWTSTHQMLRTNT
jgi:hypothetical protein